MAKITAENPYDKGTKQYRMFQALKSGKEVTADELRTAAAEPLSNRTMGVFLRDMESKGFRFNRVKRAEVGMVYVLLAGEAAKGVAKISVAPGSYKADAPAAKKTTAAKKAPAKSEAKPTKKALATKATASKKAAPAPAKAEKKAAPSPAKAAAKKLAAPAKPATKTPKKKPTRGGDAETKAVSNASVKGKVKLALKTKAA